MFTGLVETRGRLAALIPENPGVRLAIDVGSTPLGETHATGVEIGASIAINGCCLTVVAASNGRLEFQAGAETLSKTNLGELRENDRVNLERSLPVDGRLGGHFVQGHVDGTGQVKSITREPADDGQEWVRMLFQVPPSLTLQMVPKGSIAVDGVSLTLVDVEQDSFSVALIPHTLEVTTLGDRNIGDTVNIETDILGKYVQKLLPHLSQ